MSTSGTALVHPSTSKLGPADQAQGVYEYTPPLVLAYLRGETLSQDDLTDVAVFFGEKGMALPPLGPKGPALADPPPSVSPLVGETSARLLAYPPKQEPGRKAVKKKGGSGQVGGTGAALFQIADVTLPLLTIDQKTYFFNQLAEQLGYEVE
ncbi:hypothetical protein MA13_gp09 [Pectobacterium phage MA13]|uniref:Uncharacterized protein n=1 Tax=Pectobacterium phage MA13 TaxID=2662284 RepID=A0A5Q2F2V7_9CAUD|nr:hypothetical protein MA13_gp09 [Pectobacterium phage MA13]